MASGSWMNKKIFLLAALLFTGILVYSPHFSYQLPFHLDEWTHISNVERIHEEGFSYFLNNSPVEIGFDIFLLFISFFTDLVAVYHLLPALNAVFIAAVLFYFLKRKFNYWVGLFSIIFLASLKSNVNVLGLWFYVPVIGAITLDYVCLFFLEQGVKENKPKKIYWVVLFLFLIAFTHQSSFLVIFLVTLIYLGMNYKFLIKHKRYFTRFLPLLLPIVVMFIYLSRGLTDISRFFGKFTWGPAAPQINFNPFVFYGILLSIFAAIGFYFCYKKKKLLPFRIYALIALLNLLLFPILNFTVFSAYQRYLYHFMIASVPLSAVGFFYVIIFISSCFKKSQIKYLIFGVLILITGIFTFYGYDEAPPNALLYRSITYDEYEALRPLREYEPGRILTTMEIGATIKAITGFEPVFTFFDYKRTFELRNFYRINCELKKEFLSNDYLISEDIAYIHAKNYFTCPFLTELYNHKGNFIYRVDLEKDKLFFINRTVSFEGNNDIIIVQPDDFAVDEFTFYAWIYPKEQLLEKSRIIRSAFADGDKKSGWTININDSALLVQSGELNKSHKIYSKYSIKGNAWNFIAVTYDGNFSMYINGEFDETAKAQFIYTPAPYLKMEIGGRSPQKFFGKMRYIVLENRSLSAQEIKEIYQRTKFTEQ